MAVGWARDGAVQEQIDAGVEDAVKRARERLPRGKGRTHCMACGEPIPEARQRAVPGVFLCVDCQGTAEKQEIPGEVYNRRGSKDSQLK
jgi:phage/conjugal plasmid C-4 type zinc finger TraR family protein